jgi:hypothetical protein
LVFNRKLFIENYPLEYCKDFITAIAKTNSFHSFTNNFYGSELAFFHYNIKSYNINKLNFNNNENEDNNISYQACSNRKNHIVPNWIFEPYTKTMQMRLILSRRFTIYINNHSIILNNNK